ncbi:hypothetical protein BD324DRAFT_643835 [Kockovaella imperatae]|uniref:Uncharacterized protein n=1 Tax=Kockovaella imperatae TaxID=4999 RepID=A0A1Y1U6K7_9TREE|nr:hypothetical protein BD324DRAFT_643835 [Kockovaella imperatae]ORX33670.1 hypothetical protein BD324DRAFT_643835 [Kockovaella imperatae]
MRFISATARPSLTPLGYRLLHLSEYKLANLEPRVGGREDGVALWKEVVVREAVRTAWKSVQQGTVGDLTDWSSKGAMGLDVIEEEEEDDDEESNSTSSTSSTVGQERQWFEDLVNSLGDDEVDDARTHEWAESFVETAFDDMEYDDEGIEAFTFPAISPPLSPSLPPSPVNGPLSLPTVSPTLTSRRRTDVEVIIVGSTDDAEPEDDQDLVADMTMSTRDSPSSPSAVSPPNRRVKYHFGPKPGDGVHRPLSPVLAALPSPTWSQKDKSATYDPDWKSTFDLDQRDPLDDCADDEFMLPPPMHRSMSTDSACSTDDDEECNCVTPPWPSGRSLEQLEDDDSEIEMNSTKFNRKEKDIPRPNSGSWLDLVVDRLEGLNCE